MGLYGVDAPEGTGRNLTDATHGLASSARRSCAAGGRATDISHALRAAIITERTLASNLLRSTRR